MKRSYHPAIVISCFLQCLPDDILNQIPRTTIYEWKHKNQDSLFGHTWFLQNKQLFTTLQHVSNNRRLLKINIALIRIIALRKFIVKYAHKTKNTLDSTATTVLSNINKVNRIFGTMKTLSYLDLPYNSYLKWKNSKKCHRSLLSLCYGKHPSQLTIREVQTIEHYCKKEQFRYWPLISIYHQMIKDRAAICGKATFYKYTNLLSLTRRPIKKPKQACGIRASACFEILHIDVTIIKTADNIKAYLFLIQDNFSRAILSYRIALEKKATYTLENIKHVYDTHLKPLNIENTILLTDDGSENYGDVTNFIANAQQPSVKHLVAQSDVHFSNSMIEAVNRQLKYNYLYHQHIPSYQYLQDHVHLAVNDFNNRPHDVLKGLTPLEVLDQKESIIVDNEKTKRNRITENKKQQCCYSF